MTWQTLIPATRGRLPFGSPVPRTEPGGSFDAPIVILGVYPAARVQQRTVEGRRMNLPVEVERTSFEPGVSASAKDIDTRYLTPLGLTRADVLLIDMMPYFLANARETKGRSMATNLRDYEALNGEVLGIETRPPEQELVELARMMPGNLERLGDYFRRASPRLVLTLGSEAAAFVRNENYQAVSRRARELFYGAPARMDILGVSTESVHLAHPGLLMSGRAEASGWTARHEAWCGGLGRLTVAGAVSSRSHPKVR